MIEPLVANRSSPNSSSRRLRVLFVPQWYPPLRGQVGVQGTFCREHAHAAAAVDDVSVLSIDCCLEHQGGLRCEKVDDRGVPTFYARYKPSPIRGTTFLLFPRYVARALQHVFDDHGRPDVINVQDAYAYHVMKATRGSRIPVVITQQWTGFLRRSLSMFDVRRFRWAFSRAACVLAVNRYAEKDYQHYKLNARVHWVPNTIDTTVFYPAPQSAAEPALLHASGLDPKKRFPDILQAFAIVHRQRPDAVLHVAGSKHSSVMRLAERALPRGSYRFHGFLSKPKLADLMRSSRGFIFPSSAETFGCVLIEAMACGCPVLTTRVGGIPAVVRDGDGLFVEVGDVERIADGMLQLLDQSHSLDMQRIGEQTRERFSREAVGRILHAEHLAAVEETGTC